MLPHTIAIMNIRRVLAPWFDWAPGVFLRDPERDGIGSFRHTGTGGETKVVGTIVHELGHLLHFSPEVRSAMQQSGFQVESRPRDQLARYISTLSAQEQIRSEVQARATNLLIAQLLDRPYPEQMFWALGSARDHSWLRDGSVLEQSRTIQTQAVANRVLGVLLNSNIDLET